jgi:predicted metalloprotease with PDZ domain
MVEFTVNARQSNAHIFDVTMVIEGPKLTGQRISLANWTPGSYLIRDFAKHIIRLHAPNLNITKIDSHTWEIKGNEGPFIIEYQVYAFDPSVRGAYLDDEQGFINGACLFMRVHDQEQQPHRVSIVLGAPHWQCATTLPLLESSKEPLSFEASSYDDLIDHPLQMGQFERHDFEVLGIPHSIVITGQHDGDIPRLLEDTQKICENQLRLFGVPAPFERYLFLLSVKKDLYGGLEHRSSTALQIPRDCMPVSKNPEKSQGYISLLALISHEYFHAWNVKKIKPQCFEPYDLDRKAYTSQLWAFEGITSYYDDLALVRSKVISSEQYLDVLAQNITKLLRNPGRTKQTLLESSFDAWIKFYQPNENSPNTLVSYYLKGSLVALAIDLSLRMSTNHRVSLDTVMLALWEKHGKLKLGVPEGAIEKLIIELGGKAIEPLVQRALYTTEDLDFNALMAPFGIELSLRMALGSDDLGGKRPLPDKTAFQPGTLQCTFTRANGKMLITSVYDNGAAQKGGLCPQDELIAINGLRVDPDQLEKTLKRYAVGECLDITIFRQDMLKSRRVTLAAPNQDTAQLILKASLSANEKYNLHKWLFNESHSLS